MLRIPKSELAKNFQEYLELKSKEIKQKPAIPSEQGTS